MTDHITSAAAALPYGPYNGMPEEKRAAIALAHATLALAEQAKIANRIALIAAHAAGGLTPGTRAALDQISDELTE